MVREKPYHCTKKSWSDILEIALTIPMNQRNYSWTERQIKQFIDDIIKIFEEGKFVEKMGSMIVLTHNGKNEIYDAQQRTISIILTLYNIAQKLPPNMRSKIIDKLSLDGELDELTEKQIKLKEEKNIDIIPKLYCVNPYDMNSLCDIFNNKCNHHFINYITYDEECEKYSCKICDETIKDKSKVYRHLEKQHEIDCKPKISSKIYKANELLNEYLTQLDYNEEKYKELYKFIIKDIDIEFCACTNATYVSRIFDWENNRGNEVLKLDIVKNYLLVKIDDSKKYEVYDKWEKYKKVEHNIYRNDYGKKLMDVAIQLYNGKIESKKDINIDDLYKPIIEAEDTYSELMKYFGIIDKLIEIMHYIKSDKFGRLILNIKQVSIAWEGYMYLLLPIFFTVDINSMLIELIVKWYFRNIGIKTYTFNNFAYCNKMVDITNNLIENSEYNYYNEVKTLFENEMDEKVTQEQYKTTLESLSLKGANATYLLMFLETYKRTDIETIPLDYTIEHIIPQSKTDELKERKLMHNLGNLTLLEGSNSQNGHKGNSAIGKKIYTDKINSYRESSSLITRELASEYNDFNEENILTRFEDISKQLISKLIY